MNKCTFSQLGVFDIEKNKGALTDVAQLVGARSHKLEGLRFNPWSGHMPRLLVWSPVRACTTGNQLVCLSHVNVSLPSVFPSLSLSFPSLISKINKHSLAGVAQWIERQPAN